MLTTKKARAYKPAFTPSSKLDFEREKDSYIYTFETKRVKIQHNKIYKNAIAILIDNKVISLKDSYAGLTDAVSKVYYNRPVEERITKLYNELSGRDEGAFFWFDS